MTASRSRQVDIDRVAMVSMHTSPLAQPGSGDAGGLNVYVKEVSQRLAERGIAVDIFTRADAAHLPMVERMDDAQSVHHLIAGPQNQVAKEDLPGLISCFALAMQERMRYLPGGPVDILHSHYWLSGVSGIIVSDTWDIPLTHTAHTLGLTKNRDVRPGDALEPNARILGEQHIVEHADLLVANTTAERDDLLTLYDASRGVEVINPGVDVDVFFPGDQRAARHHLGLPTDADIVTFVGRLQPLKAPDFVLHLAQALKQTRTEGAYRSVHAVICGADGPNSAHLDELRRLAHHLQIDNQVTFLPPQAKESLAEVYRAATVVTVPSHSETFGLVAAEAMACGVPVVAANVGGLREIVLHEHTGLLVSGHHLPSWSAAVGGILDHPRRRSAMATRAHRRGQHLSWEATTDNLITTYRRTLTRDALHRRRHA